MVNSVTHGTIDESKFKVFRNLLWGSVGFTFGTIGLYEESLNEDGRIGRGSGASLLDTEGR